MKSITNNEAMNLVHRLRADGNLIWYFGAKVILVLPNDTVSVKNKVELIRALRESGYLHGDQTLDKDALWHFRLEADETMLDAEDFLERFRGYQAVNDLMVNSHNTQGIKDALTKHVGGLRYNDYLTSVEIA